MKTEELYKEAFKQALLKDKLDEISPLSLSNIIHKTKQSFYYHFRDLNDLLTCILIDDLKKELDDKVSVKAFINVIENYRKANEQLFKAILDSALVVELEQFINSSSSYFFTKTLQSSYPNLKIEERLILAKYLSGALSSVYLLCLRDARLTKKIETIHLLFTKEKMDEILRTLSYLF